MTIETNRLNLIPLTGQQLKLWTENIDSLEIELGCYYRGELMDGEFLDIVKGQIEIVFNDEANYLYHSFWLMIRKSDSVAVGSACFKNIPNENKEVEIGYGLSKEFEGNGYMTETIQAMCTWVLQQEMVENVIAETESNNPLSERVLERCGFRKYKEVTNTWWKLL